MRNIHKNVPVRLQPREWTVEETVWNRKDSKIGETIFTIANGYLGIRGFFEEGFFEDSEFGDRTTMINGVYEFFPYKHVWCRPGFPKRYHTIVGQANPFDFEIFVDGEKVDFYQSEKIKDYKRVLDLKTGNVNRTFKFTTENGKEVSLSFDRFASQENKHLALCKFTVTASKACTVKIKASLAMPVLANSSKEELGNAKGEIFDFIKYEKTENVMQLNYKTKKSGFVIAVAVADTYSKDGSTVVENGEKGLSEVKEISLADGESLTVNRSAVYATSRDFPETYTSFVKEQAKASNKESYESQLEISKKHLDIFWENTDVQIDTDVLVQQGLRFSAFQIFQSTGKDGITNISANGLSGTAYCGHTFWDTEVFMMPMYIYTNPEIARQLLLYRYNILDKARERASQMDDVGALFSWNSINGEECGHVFEAATAQYHINNDVFYAIYRYYEATEDEEFIRDYGAEILFEISKCMAHRGAFIPTKGNKFCINVICGPDEYNPVVDNNLYTNVLTQKQLYFTLKVADLLKEKYPEKFNALCEKCAVDENEMALWKKAADNMYIPYSKELELYMQDDNFLYKDPIDVDSIPKAKLPLLTNLHPLNLWRYQVIKQADIILLTFICSEYFTAEQRKKIFDYYEPKTIHDSSLSASIHSIVACDVGDKSDAYGYLKQAVRMDLDNVNGNTYFGLHAACMGASWMMVVNGYAGLRIYDNMLHFKPFINEGWKKFTFSLLFRGTRIKVSIDPVNTEYQILSGKPITIEHNGKQYVIENKLSVKTMEN